MQAPERLHQALALHQSGQLIQAQTIYEEILTTEPGHLDVINLLGAVALQTGNPQRAAELFGQAAEIDPTNVVAYCNSGWALWQLRKLDAALANYDRAVALNDDVAEAHFNRGNVLRDLKQPAAALLSYRRAIVIEPDYAEAYQRCGDVLCELGQWDEALANYDHALTLVPDYEEVHFGRGIVLEELQQWDAALACFDQAIAVKSDYAKAHFKRGNLQARYRQWAAALTSYDNAIASWPDYAEAHSNRGIALKALRQRDAAMASFDRAIALKPDYADAHSNRGNVLKESRQWEAALISYDQAIALESDHAEAHVNKAMMLLLRGNFDAGWTDYEWRRKLESKERDFSQPLWYGEEPIAGKTILLYCEQGLGDTLQFCRYVRLVSCLGAKVILEIQKPLERLLGGLQGASQVITNGDPLPDFDYHCPLLSLPLAFGTRLETIPPSARYLVSDAARVAQWQTKLGKKTRPRIGLVWSGSLGHNNDFNRSVPLVELVRHLPAGLQYVSLQKDMRAADRRTLQSNPGILQFADELTDFSETAALCECMDLVISVDTSVAHLSAALGKATWILLPFVPDWRWLLEREDSPWYPTAKLYRQTRAGDWDSVIRRIRSDLALTHTSWPRRRNPEVSPGRR